jgi:quercetin dioxygenase-like cupin family protein
MVKAYSFAGTTMTIVVSRSVTDGVFSLIHMITPSGVSTPPHSHDTDTEVTYMLDGEMAVETEDTTSFYEPGEACVLPPTRPHRLYNDSGETNRSLVLCHPADFELFVAEAGTPVAPFSKPRAMSDEDRSKLVELAPKYKIRLLHSATPPDGGRVSSNSPRIAFDLLGVRFQTVASTGDRDRDLVVLRVFIPAGHSFPLLSHGDFTALFVEHHKLEVLRGGSWSNAMADEAVFIAADELFAIRNSGSRPTDGVWITTEKTARKLESIGAFGMGEEPAVPEASDFDRVTVLLSEAGFHVAPKSQQEALGVRPRQ